LPPEDARAMFDIDILINRVTRDENYDGDKVTIKGAIFNWRREMMVTDFVVYGAAPCNYFESLEVSNSHPVFTRVKGKIIQKSIVKEQEVEGAFGEPMITSYTSTKREYVITWAAKEPYLFPDESTLTAEDVSQMQADREVKLATNKQLREKRNAENSFAVAADDSGFNF
jgi:hypothetical protein